VSVWRKLYNGIWHDGVEVKYSLTDAASKVGVSKGSLDDYLSLINFGIKNNFDFLKNKN
jgi:hypothetical protein